MADFEICFADGKWSLEHLDFELGVLVHIISQVEYPIRYRICEPGARVSKNNIIYSKLRDGLVLDLVNWFMVVEMTGKVSVVVKNPLYWLIQSWSINKTAKRTSSDWIQFWRAFQKIGYYSHYTVTLSNQLSDFRERLWRPWTFSRSSFRFN